MAIVDVIKWNGAPETLAWKYPSEELGTWTQMIVAESQEAFLFKGGQPVGPFTAGRHTLDTANYPILGQILKIATGGRSPFTAEVWYVNKVISLDVKWGTPNAIQALDPQYRIMLPVRAYGQLGLQVVDSGKFPWAEHKGKFRRLNEPDVSYHGVVYTEALGPAAFIGRARVVPLRNMGAALSPFNAFLILQGIETLAVRMDRICDNTLAVARFLSEHPQVSWVNYAGLPAHPDHALAKKYVGGRPSGILTFGVKGGRAAGEKFLDALQLVIRLVNIGDARSLATHPASTTHRQLSPAELEKAGVSEDMVRLSIGIEHIDDLRADLDQALRAR